MNEERFETLIKSLEPYAESNSGAYRFRVALLAMLGYVYLIVIVAILMGIVVAVLLSGHFNFITIKVLWIPLVLVGLVLRSLWVTIPEPDGKELQHEHAPKLFQLVSEVRSRLAGPRVDHIFISDEFNAGIVQIPRFGMFGLPHNYLIVGLPLLRALSPDEFRSVLAHEFGHLSGKHGKFSGWIYRLRQSWLQILATVKAERSYASFLFEPFLNWYAPYLNAYSFVLARQQEREADRYAIELSGRDVFARTLARMMAKERGLTEDFWPGFFRQSRVDAQPPKNPFELMLGGLDKSLGRGKAEKWFVQALQVPTGYDDTHPSLVDRLAAMGVTSVEEQNNVSDALVKADEANESAASFYLNDFPEDFLAGANRLWRERLLTPWRELHKENQQARARLEVLEQEAKSRELTIDELYEQAKLIATTNEYVDAIPTLTEILKLEPEHAKANFAMGGLLLEQKHHDGVAYLEKAMKSDPTMTGDGCEQLYDFYYEVGERELAESYRERAREAFAKQLKREQESTKFSLKDHFEPHGIEDAAINEMREQLAKVRGLSTAFLFRKVFDDGDSILVLGAAASFTWRHGTNDRHTNEVLREIYERVIVPGPTVFISLDDEYSFLLYPISRLEGAAIFTSEDTANLGQRFLT